MVEITEGKCTVNQFITPSYDIGAIVKWIFNFIVSWRIKILFTEHINYAIITNNSITKTENTDY